MKRKLKLKKEVKEVLIFVIFGVVFLSFTIWLIKDNQKAYDECMSKHNDKNFCHRLIEF